MCSTYFVTDPQCGMHHHLPETPTLTEMTPRGVSANQQRVLSPHQSFVPSIRVPLPWLPPFVRHHIPIHHHSVFWTAGGNSQATARLPRFVPVLCRLPARSPARPCASDSANDQTQCPGARRLGERPSVGTAQHQRVFHPEPSHVPTSPVCHDGREIVRNMPVQGRQRGASRRILTNHEYGGMACAMPHFAAKERFQSRTKTPDACESS